MENPASYRSGRIHHTTSAVVMPILLGTAHGGVMMAVQAMAAIYSNTPHSLALMIHTCYAALQCTTIMHACFSVRSWNWRIAATIWLSIVLWISQVGLFEGLVALFVRWGRPTLLNVPRVLHLFFQPRNLLVIPISVSAPLLVEIAACQVMGWSTIARRAGRPGAV